VFAVLGCAADQTRGLVAGYQTTPAPVSASFSQRLPAPPSATLFPYTTLFQAARSLLPIIGPETALISFQNGVQKDDLLRPIVGEAAIMGGVAYVGTNISRPGVIAQKGTMQRLVFGEFDGRRPPRAEAFLAACQRGGINAEISSDVRREIWQKFVFLARLAA